MLKTLAIDVIRLTIWLAILTSIFVPLERIFARVSRSAPRKLWSDIGYYYLNGLVPLALLAPPLALLAVITERVTPASYGEAVAHMPFLAKIGLGLIVSEVGAYWAHRWCHSLPLLWRFHAIHHSITHVDWLANSRAHPFDVVFVRLCGLAPVYMLGIARPVASGEEAMIPVLITLFGTFWSFFVHANVRWRFGWVEHLVATPAFHHWHHTNDQHRDRNFAALMPWVDRLFGTLHLPKDQWPPVYGIDEPVTGSVIDEIAHPFVRRASETG